LGSRTDASGQNKSKTDHVQRQNLLLSATLNEKVNRLANISLKNPVMIGLDEQNKPSARSSALGKKRTSLLSDDEEEILVKHNDMVQHTVDDFKLPAQLIQRYVKGSGNLLAWNFILMFAMCCFCSHCNAFYFMQFHVVRGLRFFLPF
jgi:ATP-dependent RNA helicase DDX31/DBP7